MVKTIGDFSELKKAMNQKGDDSDVAASEIVRAGGGGAKSEKATTLTKEQQIAEKIWSKMSSDKKTKISAQFSGLPKSAKKIAIFDYIASTKDQIKEEQNLRDLGYTKIDILKNIDKPEIENIIKNKIRKNSTVNQDFYNNAVEFSSNDRGNEKTDREIILENLGWSRDDLEDSKYTKQVIDQIIKEKIKKGDPIPLLVALEKKRTEQKERKSRLSRQEEIDKLEPTERAKHLKFLGYTPENSEDISKADLDWAIATNTMYGDPLPRRVFGAPIEITENIGSREYLLKENQALLEKMKTFDGSLEDAQKLIDEQYDLHVEIEGINKQIHDWKVDQQKISHEKSHKVVEPPTNLPTQE